MQVNKYSSLQIGRYATASMQMWNCENMQICKNRGMEDWKYASFKVCNFAMMQLGEHATIQECN